MRCGIDEVAHLIVTTASSALSVLSAWWSAALSTATSALLCTTPMTVSQLRLDLSRSSTKVI